MAPVLPMPWPHCSGAWASPVLEALALKSLFPETPLRGHLTRLCLRDPRPSLCVQLCSLSVRDSETLCPMARKEGALVSGAAERALSVSSSLSLRAGDPCPGSAARQGAPRPSLQVTGEALHSGVGGGPQ